MQPYENTYAHSRNTFLSQSENMTPQSLVDEATFEFTMGDHTAALEKLEQAVKLDPACFAAWHAMAEIQFDQDNFEAALDAGNIAVGIKEDDIHIHTSLSRIWMELGNTDEAEKHGARARILGWKDQLKEPR
jgi:tetratricopeptide (TPR) repeat protein